MFGLGFFEIILILVGILIFIRPQDLPAFVYRVGKVYGQIKEAYNKFYRELNLIKNQMDEIVEKKNLETKQKNEDDAKTQSHSESPTDQTSPHSSIPADTETFQSKNKDTSKPLKKVKKSNSRHRNKPSTSTKPQSKSKPPSQLAKTAQNKRSPKNKKSTKTLNNRKNRKSSF